MAVSEEEPTEADLWKTIKPPWAARPNRPWVPLDRWRKELHQKLAEYICIYMQDCFVLSVIVFAGCNDYWGVLGAAFPLIAVHGG